MPPRTPTRRGRLALGTVLGTALVVAACSILYELLLAQTLSALLGDTVLRYSITIGCYLGALGIGAMLAGARKADAARRLVRTELGLVLLGGGAVPLFFLLDAVARHLYGHGVPWGAAWPAVGFLAVTHLVIIGIGVLSGFEIPLLIALAAEVRPRSANLVLAVDYFGSLIGSVLFPLVLLPSSGLLATGFMVALLNAAALGLLVAYYRPPRVGRYLVAAVPAAALLVLALIRADDLERHFVAHLYFSRETDTLGDLLRPSPARDRVEHFQSRYQAIDIVRDEAVDQWIFDVLSRQRELRPARPRDVWLYLEGEFQLFSGNDEFYHEWFAHAPIQGADRVPRRVLVLGGGDGLLVDQLLAYAAVERVVHVELDARVLELAREHHLLSRLVERAFSDPRVETVVADAFHWLRQHPERFDAVYVDMPIPRNHNLSMVYSREFYGMIRGRLNPGGFMVMDAPSGWCGTARGDWPIHSSTLRAAGFRTVVPFLSRLDARSPAIDRWMPLLDTYAGQAPDGPVELSGAAARAAYRRDVEAELARFPQHEFILAFPEVRELNERWVDHGLTLSAFGPHELTLAFDRSCPAVHDARAVNSVFRPTLPTLAFAGFRIP